MIDAKEVFKGRFKSSLMRTLVAPIVKNGTGDVSDRWTYRHISLATIVAQLALDEYLRLHDGHFGYQPGLSTESDIVILKHSVS